MVPVVNGTRWEGMGSLEDPRDKLGSHADVVAAPVARLDDRIVGDQRISFIKCDVEGHEDRVFDGATHALGGLPVLLVEIEYRHRESGPDRLIDRLSALGLTGWAVFGDGLRPVEEFDLERDQLRYLDSSEAEQMPAGYVHDFLFTPPQFDVSALRAP